MINHKSWWRFVALGATTVLLVLLTAAFGLVIVSGDTWSPWHGVGLAVAALLYRCLVAEWTPTGGRDAE